MSYFMEECLDISLRAVLPVMQNRILANSSYFGIKTLKSPTDAWIYQEIIYDYKPDAIIEIGNFHGGSALMLAHLCDAIGHGKVIGLDICHDHVPQMVYDHSRITLIEGDACDEINNVKNLISPSDRLVIIEDSSHTYENTLNVMRAYSSLLKAGDWLIVEDSICHHGLDLGPKPGPYEAIETFLSETSDFDCERNRENFIITWNPKGYLRCNRKS